MILLDVDFELGSLLWDAVICGWGRWSTPSIHIDRQYRPDGTFYTKVGILSTQRGPFLESHERQSTVEPYS